MPSVTDISINRNGSNMDQAGQMVDCTKHNDKMAKKINSMNVKVQHQRDVHLKRLRQFIDAAVAKLRGIYEGAEEETQNTMESRREQLEVLQTLCMHRAFKIQEYVERLNSGDELTQTELDDIRESLSSDEKELDALNTYELDMSPALALYYEALDKDTKPVYLRTTSLHPSDVELRGAPKVVQSPNGCNLILFAVPNKAEDLLPRLLTATVEKIDESSTSSDVLAFVAGTKINGSVEKMADQNRFGAQITFNLDPNAEGEYLISVNLYGRKIKDSPIKFRIRPADVVQADIGGRPNEIASCPGPSYPYHERASGGGAPVNTLLLGASAAIDEPNGRAHAAQSSSIDRQHSMSAFTPVGIGRGITRSALSSHMGIGVGRGSLLSTANRIVGATMQPIIDQMDNLNLEETSPTATVEPLITTLEEDSLPIPNTDDGQFRLSSPQDQFITAENAPNIQPDYQYGYSQFVQEELGREMIDLFNPPPPARLRLPSGTSFAVKMASNADRLDFEAMSTNGSRGLYDDDTIVDRSVSVASPRSRHLSSDWQHEGGASASEGRNWNPNSWRPDLHELFARGHVYGQQIADFGQQNRQDPAEFCFSFPIGCAKNEVTGEYIICDTGHNVVKIFDLSPQGSCVKTVINSVKFKRPAAVVVLANNTFAVRDDTRIHMFSHDGQFMGSTDERPGKAYGLSLDSSGNLVTLETKRRNDVDIVVVDPNCGEVVSRTNFTAHQGKPGSKLRFIDCYNDLLYIVDLGASFVYGTTLAGENMIEFGGFGRELGRFNEPSGITIDCSGHMIIGDSRNDRILAFSPDARCLGPIQLSHPIKRPSGVRLTSDGYLLVMNYLKHHVSLFQLRSKE